MDAVCARLKLETFFTALFRKNFHFFSLTNHNGDNDFPTPSCMSVFIARLARLKVLDAS